MVLSDLKNVMIQRKRRIRALERDLLKKKNKELRKKVKELEDE